MAGYEVTKRVEIESNLLAAAYKLLKALVLLFTLYQVFEESEHITKVPVEGAGQPFIFPVGEDFHECPSALLDATLLRDASKMGNVSAPPPKCAHWDALTATSAAGGRAFITTQYLDVTSRQCTRRSALGFSRPGACTGGRMWQPTRRTVAVVSNPEAFELKVMHAFRTPDGHDVEYGDCRKMHGELVRWKSQGAMAEGVAGLFRMGDARTSYDVLQAYPATNRVTTLPVRQLLASAGIDLDAPSDSPGMKVACEAWKGDSPCLYYMGDSLRAVGLVLQVHILYSNLWRWRWLRLPAWLGRLPVLLPIPAEQPSFRVYAEHVPESEAARVHTVRSRGRARTVRHERGLRIEILSSGVVGIWPDLGRILLMLFSVYLSINLAEDVCDYVVSWFQARDDEDVWGRLVRLACRWSRTVNQVCIEVNDKEWVDHHKAGAAAAPAPSGGGGGGGGGGARGEAEATERREEEGDAGARHAKPRRPASRRRSEGTPKKGR